LEREGELYVKSIFMDNIWDVPTILDSFHHRAYAEIKDVPALGYKVFDIKPSPHKMQKRAGIAVGNVLENEKIKATVNGNGTMTVLYKETGKEYKNINFYTSQGEVGNAWKHESPEFDRKYSTLGTPARIYVAESGELSGTIVTECEFEVPESCAVNPSDIYTKIPIKTTYTLDKGADYIKVKTELVNNAKDHWLRVNFQTDIHSEVSVCDSHFDIVKHPIAIPDSTGWVEQAYGMQPLRTFAAVTDNENGFAVMPKGLFEYEVFDNTTMALTLIRSCRIKLAVSEEKVTELEDDGVQCPGKQTFEYAIRFGNGEYASLPNKAAEIFAPVKCAVCGRGKGDLPMENSLLSVDNQNVHVTAVKRADDGNGVIVRYYNATETEQSVTVNTQGKIHLCNMDESIIEEIDHTYSAPAKKIVTVRIVK
ncbi:MAG: glycosyl hydrolase-related protein, partial [Clostridia bacterium]|nr:glycosyl hydrolase-related protein [Clostridia bacterium]